MGKDEFLNYLIKNQWVGGYVKVGMEVADTLLIIPCNTVVKKKEH